MTDRSLFDVDEARLRALAAPPPPRRTDVAFARAVAGGVEARRRGGRAFLALPALATVAAAVALVVLPRVGAPSYVEAESRDAGVRAAAAPIAGGGDAVVDLLANDFAIPSLEGSSDEELARLDRALDAALREHGLDG